MLIRSDGKAFRRPVLSPDGTTLAVLALDDRIHLINLSEAAQGRKFVNGLKITKATRPFIRTCTILRWSPEVVCVPNNESLSNTTSECDFGKSWLLLSDGRHVIALSTDLRSPRMMPKADEEGLKSNILAEYDLGDHMGKVSHMEFVLDHRHALVISELGSSAAILNLTGPQRDDIHHVKFPDARTVAQSPDSRYFALLRRDKAQDKITVFQLGENKELSYKSFDCNTADAQNITWCPTGQPLLAVWESPTYGVRVLFFTAQGHALSQFDVNSTVFQWDRGLSHSGEPEGIGLTYWNWSRANRTSNHLTLQAMSNGDKQVLLRYQSTNTIGTRPRARIVHPNVVEGSKTFVWVESNKITLDKPVEFTRQSGAFEVAQTLADSRLLAKSDSQTQAQATDSNLVDIIEMNSTHTLVATRIRSSPRTLFLWRPHSTAHPQTVFVFKHAIRQIHFHPFLPHVLVIITNSKHPRVYAWFQHTSPPIAGLVPIDTSSSTNFSGSWLPECVGDGPNDVGNSSSDLSRQRCPFLFTSNTAFEAGYLSSHEGQMLFESILTRPSQQSGDVTLSAEGDESTTELVDTPSRPSKSKPGENSNGLIKKARFDVPEEPETDWKEDSVHEEAGYAYAW